eukprot:m.142431 g.142431  ORF g.142431 m.142431 type:complete len:562 (-) comp16712_c0_seq2:463-2148(-)
MSDASGFWRRMAAKVPGSIKAVAAPGAGGQRTRHLSFSEFDSELSDAWSENEDEFLRASNRSQARNSIPPATSSLNVSNGLTAASGSSNGAAAGGAAAPGSSSSAVGGPSASAPGVGVHMMGGKAVKIDVPLLESPLRENSVDGTVDEQKTPAGSPRSAGPTHTVSSSSLPVMLPSATSSSSATGAAAGAAAGTSSTSSVALQRLALNILSGSEEAAMRGFDPERPLTPPTPTSSVDARDQARTEKFNKLLAAPLVDLEALRQLSWSGVPASMRPTVWGLLSGYLPANQERREQTLALKRTEYMGFVEQYFHTRSSEAQHGTYHQIHIDVLRTNPAIATFQNPVVQEMFERILYIWALRHPGSGYVQGINDLVTPFFAVFMSPYVDDIENSDISAVPQHIRDSVEADSYWCMNKLLDGIQDNYTFANPGIQKNLKALKELVTRIDGGLQEHLEKYSVEYLQFAFRWMNCLLMREMPLQCTVRLWDTYHAEVDGFATFHLYVCAAFLRTFSKSIVEMHDFHNILMFIQNLPTQNWSDKEVELLLAEAYRWKYMFHDARKHLS